MRIAFALICFSIINGCTTSNESIPDDELHRPADYQNRLNLTVSLDKEADNKEYHKVLAYESERDFENFVDQLWKLAFSGDSKVYGVNYLGEFDSENKMDPSMLVESLKQFDTISVEDLMTGEIKDSVIDLSFSIKDVSALSIFFNCGDGMSPYAVGFGKQVFDMETGDYRGIANKFFIQLDGQSESDCKQRLSFESDSTGLMRPSHFAHYYNSESKPFQESVIKKNETTMTVEFDLILDSKGNRILMKSIAKEVEA